MPGAVALVAVLGAVEAGLYALRRTYIIGPATGVETRMRRALYAKLQDLPVAFHDRWPSGQLLSRVDERPQPHPPVHRVRRRATSS